MSGSFSVGTIFIHRTEHQVSDEAGKSVPGSLLTARTP
jgi:hypothetical protein